MNKRFAIATRISIFLSPGRSKGSELSNGSKRLCSSPMFANSCCGKMDMSCLIVGGELESAAEVRMKKVIARVLKFYEILAMPNTTLAKVTNLETLFSTKNSKSN